MGKYILKRLGYMLIVFMILSLLMYLVYAMIPFDRARVEADAFKDVYNFIRAVTRAVKDDRFFCTFQILPEVGHLVSPCGKKFTLFLCVASM